MYPQLLITAVMVWLLAGACAPHPVHHAPFAAVDQDASGVIEWHEFSPAYPEASPKSFLEADRNKDGEITPAEWETYMQRFAP